MSNKMIIDSSHPEETRVVVVKGNRLEEFDFESQHKRQIRGNIYLAKVTRVEPSLQAAFVDYGGNRHGFLAFSEIHPDYYQIPLADRQALLAEEEAQTATDFDDEDNEQDNRSSKRGRRRRGRGRRGDKAKTATSIPAAEPVAMDAILAALDADGDNAARATQDAGDKDDDSGKVIAARTDNGDAVGEMVDDAARQATTTESDSDDDDDGDDDSFEDVGEDDALEESRPRRRPSRRQYKIQEVIKRRQVLLVQVVKEERGNKGAALTTYMSLAGRYSVLMPNTARGGGISRKITTTADRKRLKDLVKNLDVPKGMGVILRTAGANRTQQEIERDYDYLMRLWDNVRDLTLSSSAPSLVYEEGSIIKRSIRDLHNKDISEIIVAGEAGYLEARDFMKMLMPNQARQVKAWRDNAPILARTGIESQLDSLIQPQVTLKSGGYIIINQTEALVAIDVNSGKSTREHSIEETALATNLEAAEEVARQLRLRDLAGLIVIDFIDMDENRNNRAVERKLKDCLKHDRARIQVGRISHFGLMEMSRQRMRASVLESTMSVCETCNGTGYVRSPQSVALHVIRSLEEHLLRQSKFDVTARTTTETALYILNNKRQTLAEMEDRFGVSITIAVDPTIGADLVSIDRGEPSNRTPAPSTAVGMGLEDIEDDDLEQDDAAVEALADENRSAQAGTDDTDNQGKRKRRSRGRRGRERTPDEDAAEVNAQEEPSDDDESANGGRGKRKRRSRGRRGGRNRRDRKPRIPDAEPVGPLADLIGAQANDNDAETDDRVTDAATETAQTPAPELPQVAPAEPATELANTDSEAQAAEARDKAPPAKPEADDEAGEPNQREDDSGDEPPATTAEETPPVRKRATAANLNLDVEPVVVSDDNSNEGKKPKRGGWWARGKGFFG